MAEELAFADAETDEDIFAALVGHTVLVESKVWERIEPF